MAKGKVPSPATYHLVVLNSGAWIKLFGLVRGANSVWFWWHHIGYKL